MEWLRDSRAAEQAVREETLGELAAEAATLEHALDLALRLTQATRMSLDHTLLRAMLISRAVGSLRCAWLATGAGYRTQALTLGRGALEDYATAEWVTKRPDDARLWLWAMVDSPRPADPLPRFSEMFDELDEETESSQVFRGAYGFLSEAAHPRAPGLQWNAQFGKGDKDAKHSANLLPVYDKSATATCLHHLLLVAYLILDAALKLRVSIVADDPEETDVLFAEARQVTDALTEANRRIRPFVRVADETESGNTDPAPTAVHPAG